ncbi:MAG: hypothetical protein ACI8PZ_002569 [Myxococcota bacterium]|jgi:hypothetical protein
MPTLTAPDEIRVGQPIPFSYTSETRLTGRVRLTAGTDALTFQLEPDGRLMSEPAAGHRIRGRAGSFRIWAWGDHPVGSELVLRFEGAKVWMRVVEPEPPQRSDDSGG